MKRTIFGFGLIAIGFLSRVSAFAESNVCQEMDAGFLVAHVNSPESKYEEYGEIPNGVYLEHYGLRSESGKTDFEFNLNKARQDNQSANFKVEGAKYTVKGSYDQIPHLYSKEARTLFIDDGHGNLTLPDPIQQTNQTGGNAAFVTNFSSFAAGAHTQELKTLTTKGRVGMDFALAEGLKFNVGVGETMKKGYQAKGIRIDSDFTEVARPVDFTTYDTSAGLGYAGSKVQWGLNYNFSSFNDGLDSLTVDNPIRLTDAATGSGRGRVSLEPDNIAHNVSFDGGVNLPAHSRFTAKTSFNYMRQNQNLIPYTVNSFYAESNLSSLPREKANAKTLNWVQDYDLSSRPIKPVTVGVRYHTDQINNRTEEIDSAHNFWTESSSVTVQSLNEPFNYRKESLAGRVGLRLFNPLNMNFKYGRDWIARDNRELQKNHEDSINVSADLTPFQAVLVRASFLNARRRMTDFSPDDNQIPNIRLFDIADRDRNQGNLMVQVNHGRINASMNGGLGHDKYLPGLGDLTNGNTNYADQAYGLMDTRSAKAGADIDLDVSDRVGINAYYEYQLDKSTQKADNKTSGQTSADQGTFTQRQDTCYHVGGLGVNISAIKEFLDVKFGYDITSSKSNYDFLSLDSINATNAIGGGAKTAPAETKSTKQDFSVKGKIRASSNLSIKLAYLFEKYDVFDWATNNLGLIAPSASTQRNIFLGDATHDYRAHIVSVAADYKF